MEHMKNAEHFNAAQVFKNVSGGPNQNTFDKNVNINGSKGLTVARDVDIGGALNVKGTIMANGDLSTTGKITSAQLCLAENLCLSALDIEQLRNTIAQNEMLKARLDQLEKMKQDDSLYTNIKAEHEAIKAKHIILEQQIKDILSRQSTPSPASQQLTSTTQQTQPTVQQPATVVQTVVPIENRTFSEMGYRCIKSGTSANNYLLVKKDTPTSLPHCASYNGRDCFWSNEASCNTRLTQKPVQPLNNLSCNDNNIKVAGHWCNDANNIDRPMPTTAPAQAPIPTPSPARRFFMFGPWIGSMKPVDRTSQVGANTIYMIQDGKHVKMVDDKGEARYYEGSIDQFDGSRWSTYTNANKNYILRECPMECDIGCDENKKCLLPPTSAPAIAPQLISKVLRIGIGQRVLSLQRNAQNVEGGIVWLWDKVGASGNDDQRWTIDSEGYIFPTAFSQRVLTVDLNATILNNGTGIFVNTKTPQNAPKQKWRIEPSGVISLQSNPNMVLTIEGGAQTRNGGKIWLWTRVGPEGNGDQKWILE